MSGVAIKPVLVTAAGRERSLEEEPQALRPATLLPGGGPWEVELGFGKGRYLLASAQAQPQRRFLGIEVATYYYRLLSRRAARRGVTNLATVRGDALYVMAALLPRGFAAAVHVYFPDPWPKSRHHKRRLFEPETVDLVLGLLQPGGSLWFATDFLEYGDLVREILAGFPGIELTQLDTGWPQGPRTNYEAKFVEEGRPILRLQARLVAQPALHPAGRDGLLVAAR